MAGVHLKYPLTPEAKEEARRLVRAWDRGQVEQYFAFDLYVTYNDPIPAISGGIGVRDPDFSLPHLGVLCELAEYKLLILRRLFIQEHMLNHGFEVVLLQALRDAVRNDFLVSAYHLAAYSAGTVVLSGGNGVIHIGPSGEAAPVPSPLGRAITPHQMAQLLMDGLQPEVMATNPELVEAIGALAEMSRPSPAEMRSALGRVLAQLGRSVQAVSDAAAALEAIGLVHAALTALAWQEGKSRGGEHRA